MTGSTNTQTTTQGPPSWASPYMQTGLSTAAKDLQSGAGAIVPFNQDQLNAFASIRNWAQGSQPNIDAMNKNYQFLSDPKLLDPNSNPYLKGSVNAALAPITSNYKNTVLPGINNDAVVSGLFGGSRQGVAQGLAAQDYLNQVGNTSAGMYSSAYQQGLQTMLGALSQSGNVERTGALPGQFLQGVGAAEQQQAQAESNAPWTQLNEYNNALAKLIPGLGGSTSTTVPGTSGTQNALSLAAIIASLYGDYETGGLADAVTASSDRRLKRNIKKIGKLLSGLTLYEFCYIWSPVKTTGVMADEVLELFPEAVITNSDGFMSVDYSRIW